ncbi:3'-5' exonuclease [Paenibacillus sp. GXUN7292]|uniref:3'-5' exonuclease n=1 Tax=Paenibacillus sp. GXUN7292 TaxID=3422499 RepID=UPI003D7C78B1
MVTAVVERIRGGWANVPDHLKCLTELKRMNLKPVGEPKAEVWNNYTWVKLYDIQETVSRRPATDKQLLALEKARQAAVELRTCTRCGGVVSSRSQLIEGICQHCKKALWLESVEIAAIATMASWCEHKLDYVILDVETTGIEDDDEIVEIAIVDLDETVIFETLIKPNRLIPEGATAIHGINDEMVTDAPQWVVVWPEILSHIAGKTLLTYNAAFEMRMIEATCRQYDIQVPTIPALCVMETYARGFGTDLLNTP